MRLLASVTDQLSQRVGATRQASACWHPGHNDHQAGIMGDALSGWLMLTVRNVTEGVILARFDTDVPATANAVTEGWTTIDNEGGGGRKLNLPHDFNFDYSINGDVTSLSRSDFLSMGVEIADGLILHPLFIDADMGERKKGEADEGETVEVGIRIRSKQGRTVTMALTHVYYA
jgi:hypothetical protein